MKHRFIALAAALTLLGAGSAALAASDAADPSQPAASGHGSAAKHRAEAQPKPIPASKLVDINSATSKELKKLPGITDTLAAKIIAGRPYGSKAQLVSHDVIDMATYDGLSRMIVAKQSSKDAAGSAAVSANKK